jgi:hypothetical protein
VRKEQEKAGELVEDEIEEKRKEKGDAGVEGDEVVIVV